MGKKKYPTSRVKAPATTTTKAKARSEQVEEAPSKTQDSGQGPQTRSRMSTHTDNTALDNGGDDERGATSSDHNNPLTPNPALLPVTPGPNRPETRTTNINQHPGERHNTYKAKRRTKAEMIEARRIAAIEKAKKEEEASRQAAKLDSAMKLIAKYEETLGKTNIDDTPIPQRSLHQDAEATPVPQRQGLHRTYATLDVMAAADAAPSGSEYEEPAFIEESEATNLNDGDYVEEEEEEEEEEGGGDGMLTDDYIDTNTVKVAAKAGEKRKQDQRRMIKAIDREVLDPEDNRPTKRVKDSAAVKGSTAAKSLIPRDEVLETNLKEDDGKKKRAKEKKGVVLRGAVNSFRSEQNQGLVKDSVTSADRVTSADLDKPERYVIPTCSYAYTQSTNSLLSGLVQQCDSKNEGRHH
jgi:hypothetical protein